MLRYHHATFTEINSFALWELRYRDINIFIRKKIYMWSAWFTLNCTWSFKPELKSPTQAFGVMGSFPSAPGTAPCLLCLCYCLSNVHILLLRFSLSQKVVLEGVCARAIAVTNGFVWVFPILVNCGLLREESLDPVLILLGE